MARDDGGNITGEAGGAGLGREFSDSLLNGTETYTITASQGVSVIDLEFAFVNNNIDGAEEIRNFQVFDINGVNITSSVTFAFDDLVWRHNARASRNLPSRPCCTITCFFGCRLSGHMIF